MFANNNVSANYASFCSSNPTAAGCLKVGSSDWAASAEGAAAGITGCVLLVIFAFAGMGKRR